MSLRDVVIYDVERLTVEAFAARLLPTCGHAVPLQARLAGIGAQLPEDQGVAAVPSGAYRVGDVLRPEDAP